MADSSGLGLANLKTAKTEEDFMAALKQIEVMSVSAGAPADKVKLLEVSKDAKKRGDSDGDGDGDGSEAAADAKDGAAAGSSSEDNSAPAASVETAKLMEAMAQPNVEASANRTVAANSGGDSGGGGMDAIIKQALWGMWGR